MLNCADENGLFTDKNKIYESIVNDICNSRELLKNDKRAEALEKFFSAYHTFNETINSSSFWWRFKFSYGGHIILYFIAVLVFIFLAWGLHSNFIVDYKILWVPGWAFLWGILGAILQGFWRLWKHVSDRVLRKNWCIWFFLLPIIGAILGALVYLIYFAGFIISTGVTQVTSNSFGMLLSALAGFSSWWAVKLLNTLTEMIQIKGASGQGS